MSKLKKNNINYWAFSIILRKSQFSIVFYRLLMTMLSLFIPTYIVLNVLINHKNKKIPNTISISTTLQRDEHNNCIYVRYVFVGKKEIIFPNGTMYVWKLCFWNSKYVVFIRRSSLFFDCFWDILLDNHRK